MYVTKEYSAKELLKMFPNPQEREKIDELYAEYVISQFIPKGMKYTKIYPIEKENV
jgi:hypothetical protein